MITPQVNDGSLAFAGPLPKRKGTELIVLHHAAALSCTIKDVHQWHLARGWLGCGYHYFVSKAGIIYRGRPEDTVGAHTYGYNDRSIGVCAEGDFSKEQMSAEQQAAITSLVRWLIERYPGATVKGHGDLVATTCPGEHFPFDEIAAGPQWNPEQEIEELRKKGLVDSDHDAKAAITWGEFATVINRITR